MALAFALATIAVVLVIMFWPKPKDGSSTEGEQTPGLMTGLYRPQGKPSTPLGEPLPEQQTKN